MSINDPSVSRARRLDALREILVCNPEFAPWLPESNNHIHTCFSFSPYTPTCAAFAARKAGLRVIGSVDHDSLMAAPEMIEACSMLGMSAVTGFEIRARMPAQFKDRKLNNPDSMGVAYLTVQGVPAGARERVAEFLEPVRQARRVRTLAMAAAANEILAGLGLAGFDPEADMMGRSQFANGGTVTERHLLAAMTGALIAGFGKGQALVEGVTGMGLTLTADTQAMLGSTNNPHLEYDLLGILKAEYLSKIYIQPTDELVDASEVVAFANSIGAIATYAYLGDVSASPTGDKKAEKFEDDFLEELFDALDEIGFRTVTYMPPRNTDAQIARIHQLASERGFFEISGVDINTPRQKFECPELRRKELASLNDATWALVAHEALASYDLAYRLFGSERLSSSELEARVRDYATVGRQLGEGLGIEQAVELISKTTKEQS